MQLPLAGLILPDEFLGLKIKDSEKKKCEAAHTLKKKSFFNKYLLILGQLKPAICRKMVRRYLFNEKIDH